MLSLGIVEYSSKLITRLIPMTSLSGLEMTILVFTFTLQYILEQATRKALSQVEALQEAFASLCTLMCLLSSKRSLCIYCTLFSVFYPN